MTAIFPCPCLPFGLPQPNPSLLHSPHARLSPVLWGSSPRTPRPSPPACLFPLKDGNPPPPSHRFAVMDYYTLSSERFSYPDPAQLTPFPSVESPYVSDNAHGQHASQSYLLNYEYPQYPTYIQAQPAPEYFSASLAAPDIHAAYPSELPLHAPVPVVTSGYSALISPATPLPSALPSPADPTRRSSQPDALVHPVVAEQSPLDYYGSVPQVIFPTPSELLTELNAREHDAPSSSVSASDARAPASAAAAAAAAASTGASKKGKASVKQPETQRKAYFRAVAESIGFTPTDPDTIKSHDKKRSYLECIEQYVQWLHEQIRLVGHEPAPFERVPTYRGLNSRSMRVSTRPQLLRHAPPVSDPPPLTQTLLVHMQDDIRKLHVRMVEDQRNVSEPARRACFSRGAPAEPTAQFVQLQTQLLVQHASAETQELRRHSVPSCVLPDPAMPGFAVPQLPPF
ncbi:hypothetical protein AcW2_000720 [Taiwanofungus camphoratus]|nr:hypothetical protein AcW2_000720 [Antrodia cinnamomea]